MSKVRQPNHAGAPHPSTPQSGHEGLAFVATLRGTPGRDVLDTALDALRNLHHGSSRASGILTHIPHRLLRQEFDTSLPAAGRYAVGVLFLDTENLAESEGRRLITDAAAAAGFAVLTWRDVPVNDTIISIDLRASMPTIVQVVLVPDAAMGHADIDARLHRVRLQTESEPGVYFASLSRTTIVYKGLVPAPDLALFYSDLAHPDYCTEIAVVHSCRGTLSRSWAEAQPHRILAHDGAVHSYEANQVWLRARLSHMESAHLGPDVRRLPDRTTPESSLDEFVELLHRSGRSLTHALRMVVPEHLEHQMTPAERAFYDYARTVVEPWEGTGITCFADGYLVGAVLDRYGTRSGRYWVTEAGLVVFASETGVVDLDPSTITKKGRLAPGELIAVDTVVGNVFPSDAIRAQIASRHPFREWLDQELIPLAQEPGDSEEEPDPGWPGTIDPAYHITPGGRQVVDDLATGRATTSTSEPARQFTFFDRFRSPRSRLTTPNIDTVDVPVPRQVYLGPEGNILSDGPEHARKVVLPGPVLAAAGLPRLREHFQVGTISGVYPASAGNGMRQALAEVRRQIPKLLDDGAQILVVSDRGARSGVSVPIPSLLLAATVHQELLTIGRRTQVSLIVEAGDAVEPVHVTRLLAAGAEAVIPYHGETLAGPGRSRTYREHLNHAVFRRLLSNGVAEYRAYQGSQRFHIIGLDPGLVDEVFTGAPRALGTLSLEELGQQLQRPGPSVDPVQRLLHPATGEPIPIDRVEPAAGILERIATIAPLEISESREGVDLARLATAENVLLAPPAHHDTVGPDGLRRMIEEIRAVNPSVRIHVRVGADLTTDHSVMEALDAGADVIDLVEGEYEWVFGLIALGRRATAPDLAIAVGSELTDARELFIAAALGAQEYRLAASDATAVVEDLRGLLAQAGVRRLEEIIGQWERLDWRPAVEQWGKIGVNLRAIHRRETPFDAPRPPGDTFDGTLIDLAREGIANSTPVRVNAYVSNTDASVGAQTAGVIARAHGAQGLPEDTIRVTLTGSSGASLGAYGAPGLTIIVQGEAGDFVGKGLSGGKIVVRPEATAGFSPQENVIAGSSIGYGAATGGIYLAGSVGERVGAHNWGATIVCEGAGESAGYRMHRGTLVILGEVGVNLGAGMEGGVIYALDLDDSRIHPGAARSLDLEASELDEVDERVLTAILAEHAEATQSRVATILLAEPDQLRSRFIRVRPRGYDPARNCTDGAASPWTRVLGATRNDVRRKA